MQSRPSKYNFCELYFHAGRVESSTISERYFYEGWFEISASSEFRFYRGRVEVSSKLYLSSKNKTKIKITCSDGNDRDLEEESISVQSGV